VAQGFLYTDIKKCWLHTNRQSDLVLIVTQLEDLFFLLGEKQENLVYKKFFERSGERKILFFLKYVEKTIKNE